MRLRCYNPKHPSYRHYGGRGISVCPEWVNDYDQFFADMGECPESLSLERIDNDLGYSPSNCRWATMTDQLNNQRRSHRIEYNGVQRTVSQWARLLGIRMDTLMRRLERMSPERALRPGSIRAVLRHGTRTKYEKGCRCRPCKDAHAARHRGMRARRKARRIAAEAG
jgi:hypothetical protein